MTSTDSLHQVRLQYVAEQDRLMLRIATVQRNEYRIWLTRRLVRLLWPHLVKALAHQVPTGAQTPQARKAVMAFQQEQASAKADFRSAYDEEGLNQALGDEPMLPTRVNCQPKSDGGVMLAFDDADDRRVPLNLGAGLLHNIVRLLVDVTGKVDWDLGLESPIGGGAVDMAPPGGQVH